MGKHIPENYDFQEKKSDDSFSRSSVTIIFEGIKRMKIQSDRDRKKKREAAGEIVKAMSIKIDQTKKRN